MTDTPIVRRGSITQQEWEERRDLANAINGVPDLDPFHRDDLIPNCLAWLKENW